jgi:hypothetical protein
MDHENSEKILRDFSYQEQASLLRQQQQETTHSSTQQQTQQQQDDQHHQTLYRHINPTIPNITMKHRQIHS